MDHGGISKSNQYYYLISTKGSWDVTVRTQEKIDFSQKEEEKNQWRRQEDKIKKKGRLVIKYA